VSKLAIVPASMRDTALDRVTGLDLFRMWKAGQIKTGETVQAKVPIAGLYTGQDALLGACNFNLEIEGPDEGQAIFQGRPPGSTAMPASFPLKGQTVYNASWTGKGGWLFGNGDLTVGPGIVIEHFAGNVNSNFGGIVRNWPGNLILKGDATGKRPPPTVRYCDDNLRLMVPGDYTFAMDADISLGGNGSGQTHNSYDHSLVKAYIRTKSSNCNVGHGLKLMDGISVVAHGDFRNDASVLRGPSYALDLNSGLCAVYDNDFDDEPNDSNQGACINYQTRRIWQGPHGLFFFGNRGRFNVPYRGRWLAIDNTAYDPRIEYHLAQPLGFHDMTLYCGHNDERYVDQKLDYGSRGEVFHVNTPNPNLTIITGNNHLRMDDGAPWDTPLTETDFQLVPFQTLLPRTADEWNVDVVQRLLPCAKQAQLDWKPAIDVATLPPLDPPIVVQPASTPASDPLPAPAPDPVSVPDTIPTPQPPQTDQETIMALERQLADLRATSEALAAKAQADVDAAQTAEKKAEDELAAFKAKIQSDVAKLSQDAA
jgi:hypothetical protein